MSQPQCSVGLDKSSPLMQGLLFHAPMHPQWGMRDLVSGSPAVLTGMAAQGVNKYGALPLFGASNYADFTVPPTLDGNKPVTFAWVQEPRGTSSFGTILNIKPPVNGTNAFLIFGSDAVGGYGLVLGNRNGSAVSANFESNIGWFTNNRVDSFVATLSVGINDTSGTLGNYRVWRNGVPYSPGSTTTLGLNTVAGFRVGSRDAASDPFEGLIGGMTIWQRVLTDAECLLMSTRPSAIYAPLRRPWLTPAPSGAVTVFYPGSDIAAGGWTASTGGSLASCVDEAPYDDADYITSPDLSTSATLAWQASIPAGTWDIAVRGAFLGASGQVRLVLLDAGGSTVGTSSWQTLTGSLAPYTLTVTTSGTSTKFRYEVQA